ncbi:hypothetical protein [Pseudomonas putida]|uniref:hypothetical protein n=1 Tax=Pseudomonas putida TaxID=303 RepID=UPI003906BA90
MQLDWRKVVALPIAGLVLVGQSVIGYVTENGKLPDWMPEKISWLGSVLTIEISLSLWVFVLVVAGGAIAGWWLLKCSKITAKGYEQRLVLMGDEFANCKKQLSAVTDENIELMRQLDAHNSQEVGRKEAKPEFDTQSMEFRALAAIATGINNGVPTTLFYISSALRTSKVEAHAAIDTLSALDLVSSSITGKGIVYKLTAKGRKYIVGELKG